MLKSKILDSLNWIKKLTFSRANNILLITLSYYISLWFKKPKIWGKPISISVEPTTSCNLRCPECPSGLRSFMRPTGMLSDKLFKKIINQSYRWTSYLLLYFQGEPYLHPKFVEFIKYANNKGLYTATSTNAHYLTDDNAKKTIVSGLDRLIISIDGVTQKTYENYRIGGKLDKVIEGTKNIIKWKKKLKSKTPYIIFQFLVVKPNEHQINEVKLLGKALGVDKVAFKTAQLYDFKNGNALIPTIKKYSRYKQLADGSYQVKNKLKNKCWKMWHSTVVTWNGLVVPCCFDKDAHYQFGSLTKNNLQKIWSNHHYTLFRKQLLTNRETIKICQNCTEGTKVWG